MTRRSALATGAHALALLATGVAAFVAITSGAASAKQPVGSGHLGPVSLGMSVRACWRALTRAGVKVMPRVAITEAVKRAPKGARLLPLVAAKLACRRATSRAYLRSRPGAPLSHSSTRQILCASSIGHWQLSFGGARGALTRISFTSVDYRSLKQARALMAQVERVLGKPHERKKLVRARALIWRRAGARYWLSRYRAVGGPINVSLGITPLAPTRRGP